MKVCDRCRDVEKVVVRTYVDITDESEFHFCKECNELVRNTMQGTEGAPAPDSDKQKQAEESHPWQRTPQEKPKAP
jgi:ribosome-binding protein aMBF1 (putative translation factor)